MSTTFVILAAGRGTRIGRVGASLHKALVPLEQRAVLSHLLDLAPDDAHIVVCVGHRAEQVEAYLALAHPRIKVTCILVDGWDAPGGGPGRSLLAARSVIGTDDDLVFTSCDTLWNHDVNLWARTDSWAGVAPVPAGTTPERWCRLVLDSFGHVTLVVDKSVGPDGPAYIGLSRIVRNDLPVFWAGIEAARLIDGETQVSGGLDALAKVGHLSAAHVHWTDVGDEAAYRRAVAQRSGYDWTKVNEATYILPEEKRVVKFWSDKHVRDLREKRGELLHGIVPSVCDTRDGLIAYTYVEGDTLYHYAEDVPVPGTLTKDLLEWAENYLWTPARINVDMRVAACRRFYRDKTLERIKQLPPELRDICLDAVARIDWPALIADRVEPTRIHGDFNFGNILWTGNRQFVGIDWREDFAGYTIWGDRRYDIAKLLGGCYMHWDNARRGDFRVWDAGAHHAAIIREWLGEPRPDIEIIGALALLNSAPLHAPPLDEILVARGVAWLDEAMYV